MGEKDSSPANAPAMLEASMRAVSVVLGALVQQLHLKGALSEDDLAEIAAALDTVAAQMVRGSPRDKVAALMTAQFLRLLREHLILRPGPAQRPRPS